MVCRECGRLGNADNPLDSEGYHEQGCITARPVVIPHCVGCNRMPWDCDCELGPWFTIGPLTEEDFEYARRRHDGPYNRIVL